MRTNGVLDRLPSWTFTETRRRRESGKAAEEERAADGDVSQGRRDGAPGEDKDNNGRIYATGKRHGTKLC